MSSSNTRILTPDDVASNLSAFEHRIEGSDSADERRMLLVHLLCSMYCMAGRHEEMLDPAWVVEEPEYAFFDSGRRIRGKGAIVDHHRSLSMAGELATLPSGQRIAVAEWGFASEQTNHTYLTPDAARRRGLDTGGQAAGYVEVVVTSLVWRADVRGRMQAMRWYPAARTEILPLSAGQAALPARLPELLRDPIRRVQELVRAAA